MSSVNNALVCKVDGTEDQRCHFLLLRNGGGSQLQSPRPMKAQPVRDKSGCEALSVWSGEEGSWIEADSCRVEAPTAGR